MPPRPEQGGSWPYETVLTAYLTHLLGPDRARAATKRALDELPLAPGGWTGAPPDPGTLGDVAQRVGLDGIDAEVRGVGRRIARAATGRMQCAAVARRLRDRADGRITPAELGSFYHHLERCSVCAGIVGRFEAGQWYLQAEFASLELPVAAAAAPAAPAHPPVAEVPAPVEPPTPVEPPAPVAAPPARVEPPPVEPPPVEPPAAAVRGPLTRGLAQPPRVQRRRVAPKWVRGLILGVVLVAVATAVFLQTDKTAKTPAKSSPAPAPQTTVATTPTPTPTPTAPPTAAASRGPGTPFVIAGARFAVFVNPSQKWTRFTKTVPPAPGSKWLLVTVSVRDLTRTDLDPRVLHYRLLSAGGQNYFPKLAYGTGPDLGRPPHLLAPGQLVQAELAFQVPIAAPPLQLAYDPYGKKGSVSVALGN